MASLNTSRNACPDLTCTCVLPLFPSFLGSSSLSFLFFFPSAVFFFFLFDPKVASQLKLTEEFNMARSVGGSGKAPAGTPGAGDMEEITQEQTSLTLGVRSRERCVFFLPPSLPLSAIMALVCHFFCHCLPHSFQTAFANV